jgi:hypothetical protein
MRDDVISDVINGPLREAEVRELPDDRFEETLRERGFELDPIELKTLRQVRDQAAGLDGDALEAFLNANADPDARASIELQGSDLSPIAPNRGAPPGEEADTVSGREAAEDRSGDDAP